MATFLDDWRTGRVTDPEAIDLRIAEWHDTPGFGGPPLHEYLGMSWEQYTAWFDRDELPPGDIPVWLLDVDGVINARKPGWSARPSRRHAYASCSRQQLPLWYAPALLARIRAAHAAGLAEIRWATTWCCEVDALEKAFSLPHFEPCWTDHINGRAAAMAKLACAAQVLADGRRLVWTDDSETPTSGETYERLTFDGRALLIAPNPARGLQPDDMDRIEAFCRKEPAK